MDEPMMDEPMDEPTTGQGPAFTAVLAYEGVITGDDRYVEGSNWSWPTPPFTLRVIMKDVEGHSGAEAVGVIEQVERVELADAGITTEDVIPNGVTPYAIIAKGHYDTSPLALEAARLAKYRIKRGLSVDPGGATIMMGMVTGDGDLVDLAQLAESHGNDPESMADAAEQIIRDGGRIFEHWTDARIRGVTQLDMAAFEDARVLSVEMDDEPTGNLTAAAMSTDNLGAVMLGLAPEDSARISPDSDNAHVTLFYYPLDRGIDTTELEAVSAPMARLWGEAAFNADSDERDTVRAYLVEGAGPGELRDFRTAAMSLAGVVEDEQPFDAWVPHVTVAADSVVELTEVGSEITFDRFLIGHGPDTDPEVIMLKESRSADDEDPDTAQDSSPLSAVIASAVPPHSTPVMPRGSDWDGNGAETSLPTGEEPSFYAQFYAYQAEEVDGQPVDGTAKDHWHYLHHMVGGAGSDAQVGEAVPEACTAIIQLLNGARGVEIKATGSDRQTVYDHVAKHLQDAGEEVPELKSETVAASAAPPMAPSTQEPPMNTIPTCDEFLDTHQTVTASSYEIPRLPAEHFSPIDFSSPSPLTMTEDGHVYGHIALADVCHVGMPGCVTMPKSTTSLRYFHTSRVRLDDNTEMATGKITMKGGHANVNLDWRKAMAHYDDVTTTLADVVAWEDEFGLAVSGHVRPGTPPDDLHAAFASTPSGDWRRIGNSSELISVHMVNSPGFPVYRMEGDTLVASISATAPQARIMPRPDIDHGLSPDSLIASALDRWQESNRLNDAMAIHRTKVADTLRTSIHRS